MKMESLNINFIGYRCIELAIAIKPKLCDRSFFIRYIFFLYFRIVTISIGLL